MRALLPIAALALAAALSACSGPCDALASRLCDCPPSGVSSATCRQQASDVFGKNKPSDSQCNAWLDTCNAPSGVQFCDFLNSSCGKARCGLSLEPQDVACAPTP
jgi:hypothetical protein